MNHAGIEFTPAGPGIQMNRNWNRKRWVWFVIPVLAIFLVGCSLCRGGGPKERTVELTFDPSFDLNWDGEDPKPLQVAVFVLRDSDRFLSGQVAAFFDAGYDQDFDQRFADDRIENWIFTVRPDQTESQIIRYTLSQSDPQRVYLGIIGDFFTPAGNGRERAVYALKNKSKQKITVAIGKDQIETVSRTQ